jgi:hypothetical protein
VKLYDAEPDGVPKGAVIVVQEALGITDYIEDVCNRLAAAGIALWLRISSTEVKTSRRLRRHARGDDTPSAQRKG